MTDLILILKNIARAWIANYLNKKAAKLAAKLEKTQKRWEKLQ